MKKLVTLTLLISLLFIPLQTVYASIDLSKANIELVRTELPKVEDVNVCVTDVDAAHSQVVSDYVNKYYDGSITQLPFNSYDYYTFKNCQVINKSVGDILFLFGYSGEELEVKLAEVKQDEYEQLEQFLKQYKGIIVESAGNEDDNTTLSSPIARFKEVNTDEEINNRLFVVGQIEINEDNTYTHHFSYGDEIDFVVANYGEMVNNEMYTGTSFAAPVVSGVISTLLHSGIPIEDIRNVIGYEDELHYVNGKPYKVFSVIETYRNGYEYLKLNNK